MRRESTVGILLLLLLDQSDVIEENAACAAFNSSYSLAGSKFCAEQAREELCF
jgi:hypothetical protein